MRFLVFLWITITLLNKAYGSSEGKYNYFDDYLRSLDEEEQNEITLEAEETEGSGSESDAKPYPRFVLPLRTGLMKSKDVTCCSMGHLAGDKGYHCIAKFYAARIILRNQNRAHNRKMGFYGHYSIPNRGLKLMRTFEQCVATRGQVFHKCCQHAAMSQKVKPHFDSLRRKRFEMKMKRIRIPRRMQEDDLIVV